MRWHWSKFRSQVAGPKIKNLLVGSVVWFDKARLVLQTEDWARQFNEFFFIEHLWGFGPSVWIANPASIKEVLLEPNIPKSHAMAMLEKWIGKGVLSTFGDFWKVHRRLITPSFHLGILQTFMPIYQLAGNRLIQRWKTSLCDKDMFFDVMGDLSRLTFDVVGLCAFGHDFNSILSDGEAQFLGYSKTMTSLVAERTLNPLYHMDWFYGLTKSGKLWKKTFEASQEVPRRLIRERREYWKIHEKDFVMPEDGDDSTNPSYDPTKKRLELIDILLMSHYDNGDKLTDEEIMAETTTFLFAGHDTTSSALAWLLWVLAKHQDVQERLYQEIMSVLGDREAPTIAEIREKLPYLDIVTKESLRLYATIPTTSRNLDDDLVVNGLVIPKYTEVKIMHFAVHRSEKYWKDPLVFRPERFLEDTITPYSYIPFSAGSRSCVGQVFAQLEEKSVICMLLKHFKFVAEEGFEPKPMYRIVLESANGFHIKIQSRK